MDDCSYLPETTMIGMRKFPSPVKAKDRINEKKIEELTAAGINIRLNVDKPDSQTSIGSSNQLLCCACIIWHEGRFKVLWDWFVLILVIFTAIQIPFFASFDNSQGTILDVISDGNIKPIFALSLIVDFMFILDIFINFRTSYVKSSSDIVIRQPTLLAIHYLKTWFVIDLLAAIPFDWILHNKDQTNNTSTLIGLLKSARLLRLFRVARRIDRYSEYGLAVLFLLMSLFTLVSHWLACFWNFIATREESNPSSWVRKMDESLHGAWNGSIQMTQSERYVSSLYFIVSSLTSVGFGNVAATTEAEQIFSVIVMLLGALMYASIFGNMVAIVQRLYSKTSTFHGQLNKVREFMKFYKVPEELRASINNYVRREWTVSRGVDVEAVLQRFPECIQADLTYELYQVVFTNIRPFRDATVSCMRALAMKFKTITLQLNNFVLRQGEEVNKLYILGKGSLEIITDHGELKILLAKNAIFGYDFLKNPSHSKSNSNVRVSSLVEIHSISKEDMNEILEMYPKFAKRFRAVIKLSYDLNDEFEEGNLRAASKREKIHIVAAAKSVLTLPVMSRFVRTFRKNPSKPLNVSPIKMDNRNGESKQSNGIERLLQSDVIESGDHIDRIQAFSNELKPIIKPSESMKKGSILELDRPSQSLALTSVACSNDNLQEQNNEHASEDCVHILQNKVETLEKNLYYLSTDLDKKITSILDILTYMKQEKCNARGSFSDFEQIGSFPEQNTELHKQNQDWDTKF